MLQPCFLFSLSLHMVFPSECRVACGLPRTAEVKGSIFSTIGGVAGAIKEKLTGGKEEGGRVGKRGDEGEEVVETKPELRTNHGHGEVEEGGGAGENEGMVHTVVEAAKDAVGGRETIEEKVPKM